MLQTKKTGKGGKANAKKGKKPAAVGSKGKGKKNPKKRPNKKGAKKDSADSKEGSKEQDSKSSDPCKWIFDSITFSHPSSCESCGCGASMDYSVSHIPWSTDWPVSFPLQSAVEFVSDTGLQLENIVSRLSLELGGRLAHCADSYEKIGAQWKHLVVIKEGYMPPWHHIVPRQEIAPCNPVISQKASYVLDVEVHRLLEKRAIREVSPVPSQYVSSHLAVPKSKRVPDKWRPILNLKKFNKYVHHVYFQMEELKMVRKWFQKGTMCAGLDLKDAFPMSP